MRPRQTETSTPLAASLQTAIKACEKAARRGYSNAQQHLGEWEDVFNQTRQQLNREKTSLAQRRLQTSTVERELQAQIGEVVTKLHDLQTEFQTSLENRRKELAEFSVALFGRTMAGKSTLMEILTEGEGTSIGKGAQRTTRDVRSYRWHGLKVTDVPGVAAFEGLEDEEAAFEAAKNADLVLFLITDDAPQSAEAECLARVRSLGKPILGICNVKVALDEDEDPKLFLRLLNTAFDPRRLRGIVAQFHKIAEQFTPGYRIQFCATHLRSRFLAQRETDRHRRNVLAEVSRFAAVEREIASIVVSQGRFLRAKSFIEASVGPMLSLGDSLLDFSARNASSGRVLLGKKRQTEAWRDDFRRSGTVRIDAAVREVIDELQNLIPSFTEENYDRKDAGKWWSEEVKRCGAEETVERVQRCLVSECQEQLDEIVKALRVELKLSGDFAGDRRISMDPIIDGKRAWRWGTTAVGGVLAIGILLNLWNPLGWAGVAAVAVPALGWLGSLLLEDREAKASRRRNSLAGKLSKDVDGIGSRMRTALERWLHQDLLKVHVDVMIKDMSLAIHDLFQLANTQRDLAWRLNRKQRQLNREFLREALEHLGRKEAMKGVRDVARIPGHAVMLALEPGTTFPRDCKRGLQELLQEPVWFVVDTGSKFSMLCRAIGIRGQHERSRVSVEEKIQIAHVPLNVFDATSVTRVRLAQQLSELHVMK